MPEECKRYLCNPHLAEALKITNIVESWEFTTYYNFICNSEVARGFLSITQKAENRKKKA